MNIPRCFIGLFLLGLTTACYSAADAGQRWVEELWRVGGTESIDLSPDGRRVAYAIADADSLKMVIVDLEASHVRTMLSIDGFELQGYNPGSSRPFSGVERYVPSVRFLQWVDAERLVFSRGLAKGLGVGGTYGDVRILDVAKKTDRWLMHSHEEGFEHMETWVGRGIEVIGFPSDQPETMIVKILRQPSLLPPLPASFYSINLTTGARRLLGTEDIDGRVIFDAQGRDRLLETGRLVGTRGPPMLRAQKYLLKGPGTSRGRQNLDTWLGSEGGVTFGHEDKDFFGPRSIALGFDQDPNLLYFASNAGRDTFGIYALDLRTKKRTPFAVEDDHFDLVNFTGSSPEAALIYDRQHRLVGVRVPGIPSHTHWLEPKLARLQEQLNSKFPAQSVELISWDVAMRRVVALVSNSGDPGRYIVFDESSPKQITEICQKSPWLPAAMLSKTESFKFVAPDGTALTATVTLPRQPLVKLPPLVVLCPDLPGWRDTGEFDREAQACASAGFIVLKVDYRGISGMGTIRRDAAKAALDQVPLGDVRAAIGQLATRHPFNPKRVALVGRLFGGYLALRALQLYPQDFRAAVSIDGPVDLVYWATRATEQWIPFRATIADRRLFFPQDKAALQAISVSGQSEAIRAPVLIIESDVISSDSEQGVKLVRQLKAKGVPAEYTKISNYLKFTDDRGEVTTSTFQWRGMRMNDPENTEHMGRQELAGAYENPGLKLNINRFLAAQLYDFDVKVGPTKVVE